MDVDLPNYVVLSGLGLNSFEVYLLLSTCGQQNSKGLGPIYLLFTGILVFVCWLFFNVIMFLGSEFLLS